MNKELQEAIEEVLSPTRLSMENDRVTDVRVDECAFVRLERAYHQWKMVDVELPKFETFMRNQNQGHKLYHNNGRYKDETVQCAWEIWKKKA